MEKLKPLGIGHALQNKKFTFTPLFAKSRVVMQAPCKSSIVFESER